MRTIVIRAKHGSEALAGALVHDTQELSLCGAAARPIITHADPSAIFQNECGDVDCFCASMSRTARSARNITTRIGSHCLDPLKRAAQNLARCTIDTETRPTTESGGRAALDRPDIAYPETGAVSSKGGQLHRAKLVAAGRGIGVWQRRKARAGCAQFSKTGAIGWALGDAALSRGYTRLCIGSL